MLSRAHQLNLNTTSFDSFLDLTDGNATSPRSDKLPYTPTTTSSASELRIHQLPRFLPPDEYPITVTTAKPITDIVNVTPAGTLDYDGEWVVVRKPFRKIGIGSKIYGRYRIRAGMYYVPVTGMIEERVRYERKYVVYRVKGDRSDVDIAVLYRHSKEGFWRRLGVFVAIWNDSFPMMEVRDGELETCKRWKGWMDYLWGSGWRL